MNSQSKPSVEEIEQQVKKKTAAEQADPLALAGNFLDAFLQGFQKLDPITPTTENEVQWVRRLLANKGFNSLRCAYELLQSGYYTQALTLTRSAAEDWLVSVDCETHPKTLEALLHGQGKMPSFEKMAKRNDEDVRKVWKGGNGSSEGLYGVLSTFAHPRQRGLGALLDHERGLLRFGGNYDAVWFAFTCYFLIRVMRLYSEILARLVSLASPQDIWIKEQTSLNHEAIAWEDKIIS